MAEPQGVVARWVNHLEESIIALIFAAMVLVTFSQVVARYVFNTGVTWALELTTFLFAWLVLFGMSYGVKVHAHLGVDAFVKLFEPPIRRIFGLLAVAAGLTYAIIMLVGSWQYVGKLYKIGIEAVDIPVARWIPMAILPIGLLLLLFRLVQVGYAIWTGKQEGLLLGDEAADAMRAHLDEMAESPDPDSPDDAKAGGADRKPAP